MAVDAGRLSRTVTAMRPIVPARDFEVSKRFYIELGFQPRLNCPTNRNAARRVLLHPTVVLRA